MYAQLIKVRAVLSSDKYNGNIISFKGTVPESRNSATPVTLVAGREPPLPKKAIYMQQTRREKMRDTFRNSNHYCQFRLRRFTSPEDCQSRQ
jgi:hypothetical protein